MVQKAVGSLPRNGNGRDVVKERPSIPALTRELVYLIMKVNFHRVIGCKATPSE